MRAWGWLLIVACSGNGGFTADAGSDAARVVDAGRDAEAPEDASVDAGEDAAEPSDPWACGPSWGARRHDDGSVEVRVDAPNATRVEVAFFDAALGTSERLRVALVDGRVHVGASELRDAGLGTPLYYGLRVFGPNWAFDPAWTPGSELGRVDDVDADGHRMNPNKLLLDPYALEVSHDPIGPEHRDYSVFRTGPDDRARDSGPFAPKGVVIACERGTRPITRSFRDAVIYEVHLRGLTALDPSVPEHERGTYAGAARKARYLRELGVTAIELLPLHETPNDQNELTPDAGGDNYWGYSSLSFFAPDRRYAADRSAGGPTRELRAMIDAFHAEGVEVYVDVVYNHTAEGGANGGTATLLSWRGVDNAAYYELDESGRGYVSSNGVGPNVNTANPLAARMVLDSLRYWRDLGVDGFRFDLASVVANGCTRGCYRYDATLPRRIADEFPDVDLIAEAWGAAGGTYQVGQFPQGWSEWNDRFRDAVRRDLNRLGREAMPLRELLRRLSGSPDLYEDDGRPPSASINFVVAHDGLTLHDLFRYDGKVNDQPWPFGPSDGGTNQDLAWNHTGDATRQAIATRTSLALLTLAAGVPMITGGDEHGRTLRANNNAYNLDNEANWLRWDEADETQRAFTAGLLGFRAAHAALRPERHWRVFGDADGDGLTEVRWFRDDGRFVDDGYLDGDGAHFVAWQLDGDELGDSAASLFFAYNGWSGDVRATLPEAPTGTRWREAFDTASGTFGGEVVVGERWVRPRSLVALVAEPE
ncbi:MAG: glycogen-debranching protein [Sandaracinus sp.]|nr:glycogen-debranching protein [Sandaracinus sp.]